MRQAFTQFDEVAVQVAGDALDRQLVDLVDHALQFFLQLLEAARNGRDRDWTGGRIEHDFLRFGVEVERNVELTGQQIAAPGLGPQTVFDEGAHQTYASGFVVGVMLQHLEHFGVGLAE
ncbi:hypothetical protein D3C84_930650 [compost metagenome]